MLKKIAPLLAAFMLLTGAASVQPTAPSKSTRDRQLVAAPALTNSASLELFQNLAWADVANHGPEYTITFNKGASKGYVSFKNVTSLFTAVSGSALDINRSWFQYGYSLLWTLPIAGSIIPAMDAEGWDITADASPVAADAVEVVGGIFGGTGRPFLIGTDPAFQFCVTMKVHDVDGTSLLVMGFREVEVFAANITTYTDFASIGINGAASPNTIKIFTDLNNAGEVTTDTTQTWADDATKTICELVSGAGVVTYTNGGSAPTATAAYTFADGLLVIPFVREVQAANFADDTWLTSWAVSYQQ